MKGQRKGEGNVEVEERGNKGKAEIGRLWERRKKREARI